MEKNLLKNRLIIAAIFCFLTMLFNIISNIIVSVGALLLGAFYIYCYTLDAKKLKSMKSVLLFLSFVGLLINFVSSIFVFAFLLDIDSSDGNVVRKDVNKKATKAIVKQKVDPKMKRVDILLKLGLAMIIISGIIFATTSWEVISNEVKVALLFIMSLIFYALYLFSSKRLKIVNTTKTYWLLTMVFLVFTFISVGFFETLGNWFSFYGNGSDFFLFVLYGFSSLLSYATYKKLGSKLYIYMTYFLITKMFLSVFDIINISFQYSLVFLLMCSLFLRIKKYTDSLSIYSIVLNIILLSLLTFGYFELFYATNINNYVIFIACIIDILYIIGLDKESGSFLKSFSYFLLICNVVSFASYLNLEVGLSFMLFIIILTLLYFVLILIIKNKNKGYSLYVQVLYNIVLLIAFLFVDWLFYVPQIYFLVSISIVLLCNVWLSYIKEEENLKFEFYLQPIKILAVLLYFIPLFKLPYIVCCFIYTFVMLLLYYINSNKTLKNISFYLYNAIIIVSLLHIPTNVILKMLFFSLFAIQYILIKKYYKSFDIVSYLIMLLALNIIFVDSFLYAGIVYSLFKLLFTVSLSLYFSDKNKCLFNISLVAIAMPYLYLIWLLKNDVNFEIYIIIVRLLFFYIIYLICKIFKLDAKTKNIVIPASVSVVLLFTAFFGNIIVSVFVGIISLIMVIFSYNKYEYKGIFYCGVVWLIVNILFRLRALWVRIPFWLYLLLAGLVLIGFVTYKEFKEKD